jgi:hypothetical protein
MRCRGLQGFAQACKSPYLSRFPFSALPSVAPYCVPGGIRVVSSVLIFAGHHRPPAASQIQPVEEGGPALPSIRRCDEAPVPSVVTACAWSSPCPRRPPCALRLPQPFRCPLLSKLSCALSPVGGGSRVFTVRWDYVETPLGTARPITPAVDKV